MQKKSYQSDGRLKIKWLMVSCRHQVVKMLAAPVQKEAA
jgi:hypothetical protein